MIYLYMRMVISEIEKGRSLDVVTLHARCVVSI